MLKKTIVALDQLEVTEINQLMPKLRQFSYFKLGMEVFNKHGADYIKQFSEKYNKNIFLDLKLHDIPKTVERGIKSLEGLDLSFLTIHLSGGMEMVQCAIEAQKTYLPNTSLLGVSYLTSLGNNDFKQLYGLDKSQVSDQFKRVFRLAAECQIDGLVSSAFEIAMIKEIESNYNHNFIKVTPGIRLSSNENDDQKRVMQPKDAIKEGADFLVIGRSITKASNIEEVANILNEEI